MGAPMAQRLIKEGHEITSTIHKIPTPQTLIKSGLKHFRNL